MIFFKQTITKKQELVCKIDEKPSAIKLKEKTKDPILDPQSGTCGQSPLEAHGHMTLAEGLDPLHGTCGLCTPYD